MGRFCWTGVSAACIPFRRVPSLTARRDDAISAGLDRAVSQSRVSRARTLAARANNPNRDLLELRFAASQRAAAAPAALSDAAALAFRLPPDGAPALRGAQIEASWMGSGSSRPAETAEVFVPAAVPCFIRVRAACKSADSRLSRHTIAVSSLISQGEPKRGSGRWGDRPLGAWVMEVLNNPRVLQARGCREGCPSWTYAGCRTAPNLKTLCRYHSARSIGRLVQFPPVRTYRRKPSRALRSRFLLRPRARI